MLINRIAKICVVAFALTAFAACSSTSEKAPEAQLDTTVPEATENLEGATDTKVTTPEKKAPSKKDLKAKKGQKGKKALKGKKVQK